jgi:hypothetical protein
MKYGALQIYDAVIGSYECDGKPMREYELETVTGSQFDTRIKKPYKEVLTIAYVLSKLGFTKLKITSLDPAGKPLDRPDVDVCLPDGSTVGVEHADVMGTALARQDALFEEIEIAVSTRLVSDAQFSTAYGNSAVHVSLNGLPPSAPLGGPEATLIEAELLTFFASGAHAAASSSGNSEPFPNSAPKLFARGGRYSVLQSQDPEFHIGEGPQLISPADNLYDDVVRILDRHRNQAATYRGPRNWIVLFLPFATELFAKTIDAVKAKPPAITPFERAFIADGVNGLHEIK